MCWLGLGLQGLLPTHKPGKLVLVVGGRSQFLSMRASSQGYSDIPVAPSRVSNVRKGRSVHFSYDLALEINTSTSSLFFWSHRSAMIHCGRELCKGINTRRQRSLVAILETGYHT